MLFPIFSVTLRFWVNLDSACMVLSVEDRSIYIYIPLQTNPWNPFSILKPFKQTQSNFGPTVFSQEENRGQYFPCRSHSSNAETGTKKEQVFLLFKCCYVKLSANQHQLENNRTHSALTCASVRKQWINQTNFTVSAVIFAVWTPLVSWNRPEFYASYQKGMKMDNKWPALVNRELKKRH